MAHRICIGFLVTAFLLIATPLQAQDQPKIDPAKDEPITNSIGMKLKLLPTGKFLMGTPESRSRAKKDRFGRRNPERPHFVRLTRSFLMGVTEVTQTQWQQVMGNDPSHFKGDDLPVESVSWEQAGEFCEKLSSLPAEKAAGRVYRLPTEAEWEYACRAGTKTAFSFGDDDAEFAAYAWCRENSHGHTHLVGGKLPNAWGLYDMHGNVWEWCQDWNGQYPRGFLTDPPGPSNGKFRVSRGGGWNYTTENCRSSCRGGFFPTYRFNGLGFRVASVSSSE